MFTSATLLWAASIFFLSIFDVSLGTIKDGTVTMLESVIERKNMPKFVHLVDEIDPCAFVTSEEMRFISRGYVARRDKKK
jgi:uncharacterized membrane-anchored protein YitT (DUF2179 family)